MSTPVLLPRLVDTHGHLMDEAFDADRSDVFDRAYAAGVSALVVVGYDIASSRAAIEGLSADLAHSVLAARDGTVWINNVHSLDALRDGKITSRTPRAHRWRVTVERARGSATTTMAGGLFGR